MRSNHTYETPTAVIAFLEEDDVIRTSELEFLDEIGNDKNVPWKG